MIITTVRPNMTATPYLVYCPRCKDRVRFEALSVNETFCTCTVPRWKSASNVLRFSSIRGRVTTTKCGGKCTHAVGGDCECSCGGANHGKGFSANREG